MAPTARDIGRLKEALRLETPLVALYDADPDEDFEPLVELRGRSCCFSYYTRWLRGETLVARKAAEGDEEQGERPRRGCPAALRYLGLDAQGQPEWMAHKLTDGAKGPGQGEGLKASPELAQAHVDKPAPALRSQHVLLGPLRAERWEAVRSVTFFVDPDRLSALITMAAYWSAEDEIVAPFSSGCGLLWRDLSAEAKGSTSAGDRPLISCTDIAMRKYLPAHILGFTLGAERFARLLEIPEESFLGRRWWNELLDARAKHSGAALVD